MGIKNINESQNIAVLLQRFHVELHRLFHLMHAYWYGDREEIESPSESYDKWAWDYLYELISQTEMNEEDSIEGLIEMAIRSATRTYIINMYDEIQIPKL